MTKEPSIAILVQYVVWQCIVLADVASDVVVSPDVLEVSAGRKSNVSLFACTLNRVKGFEKLIHCEPLVYVHVLSALAPERTSISHLKCR